MAIGSVLGQGLGAVEVLIVNDNPEQYAPDWFGQFGFPDSIRILHHDTNRGLSAARNTGMTVARGTRIAFLDSDDYYLTEGLAAQLALAEACGADITQAQCMRSTIGSPALAPLARDASLFGAPRQGRGLAGLEEAQFITSSWSSIYLKTFLDRNALRFDPEQVKFEDRLFVLQTVTAAERIACLGKPARVWRQRAGSISTTPSDPQIHRLQLQLLEKCMAHMRAYHERDGVAPRFLKREIFNTVSRLIWDVDLLDRLSSPGAEGYEDFPRRIVTMLGTEAFGHPIFADPVISRISRVGQTSRKGFIRREDFFELHRFMREGAFDLAARRLVELRPGPASPRKPRASGGRKLILHLGMHKTGSTYLQRALIANREPLRQAGILVPETGLRSSGFVAVRPEGLPGHLGLLMAARTGDDAVFKALAQEIAWSRCGTALLSCENMLLPISEDRSEVLDRLFDRLSMFGEVLPVAMVRRPDVGPEMFYRELVCNGHRVGARSVQEFMVDYGASLTDLPGLFGPFEAFAGQNVAFADFDAALANGGIWAAFLAASGLAGHADRLQAPPPERTYLTPGSDVVLAVRMLNAMIAEEPQRVRVLRDFFAAGPPGEPEVSLMAPSERLELLTLFEQSSAAFGALRGYRPDLAALRHEIGSAAWSPPGAVSTGVLQRLQDARLRAEGQRDSPPPSRTVTREETGSWTIRIRPRPWAKRVIDWVAARRR